MRQDSGAQRRAQPVGRSGSLDNMPSLADLRHRKATTNLLRETIGNLGVARNGLNGARRRIRPKRIRWTLPLEMTAESPEIGETGRPASPDRDILTYRARWHTAQAVLAPLLMNQGNSLG